MVRSTFPHSDVKRHHKPTVQQTNVSSNFPSQVIANKECGVLMGNWSSCYGGGIAPTAWCGSAPILKQYYKCGGVPVKYGQSVAFAGVTNTSKGFYMKDKNKKRT